MTSRTMAPSLRFVGIPVSLWLFGTRIWLALMIALAVSFWLQLEAPATAAITVTILAEPTRGRVLDKALFRVLATVIGVIAAIVFTALFSQARDLMLAAFALWLGLCVYAAGLLDGNRAYAAVLSGYSVAIVAIQQFDAPDTVFMTGMERGAAIAVGIGAIALVNDLLVAPDSYPILASRLAELHRRVTAYAGAIVRDAATDATTAAALLRDIVSLRPEITMMAKESAAGAHRAASARSILVDLVAELHAARALHAVMATEDRTAYCTIAAALEQRDADVRDGLAALRADRRPRRTWRTPLFRSHRSAAALGIQSAVCVALASAFFVAAGWSATDISLTLVAVIIALGATTPNPTAFTVTALIAAPVAGLLAGIVEFGLLDGVTAFPLLALAFAPFVIGTSIAAAWPHPLVAGLGRLSRIFALIILEPSNPQSYDPNSFLFSTLLVGVSAAVLLAAQLAVPPISMQRRRRWLLASARCDLDRVQSRWTHLAPEEAMFRDAVRIGQLTGATPAAPEHLAVLQEALSLFDRAGTIRLGRNAGSAA